MAAEAAERVAEYWSQMVERPQAITHWQDSPLISRHLDVAATGGSPLPWLEYACQKYLMRDGKGVARGLSLGCGAGSLERHARRINACDAIDAYDIAPGAIETAKRLAAEEGLTGIHYGVRDLETAEFPENAYDVVFICSAVHHFRTLETLFAQINRTLKPDGVFITHEFVGPSQFQWTPKQVQVMNELLEILPPPFRRRATAPGEVKSMVFVPTIDDMNGLDPSEAIRSAEIIPLMERMMHIVERGDMGGAVLHMLLQDIIQNFDLHFEDAQPNGETVLRLLIYLEKILTREGVLDTNWTFLVARPNKAFITAPPPPLAQSPLVRRAAASVRRRLGRLKAKWMGG